MMKATFPQCNILVVDDINANLVVLTEMISKAGYIARPVTSARQAVSAIEALMPHLILLDISMPDIDGFVFCAMLKKNANTRDIPVIFISALNSTEDKIKGFQLGAVDYIAKPFEVAEVMHRINIHLNMYKMQQELEAYNKKLYKIINEQIQKNYEEQKNVIYALVKMLALREPEKQEHIVNVGKISRILAMSLQLTPNYCEQISNSFIDSIHLASALHDIGKIAINDSIILKPSKLNEDEIYEIKTHATIGADSLKDIYSYNEDNEYLKMAIDIARYHHEHWDGSGYPSGIAGLEIPLCARIVSVADAFDSLSNRKVYKKAYSHEESMDIINKGSGSLFDPAIVNVLNMIKNQLKK